MSEIKADMGRAETLSRNPLATAPPTDAVTKVSDHIKTEVSGKDIPPVEVTAKNTEVDSRAVEEAVSKLNDYVQTTARTLNFQVDDESGKTVIKVFDRSSSELIRQIPSELALELARKLNEEEPSLLFSAQV